MIWLYAGWGILFLLVAFVTLLKVMRRVGVRTTVGELGPFLHWAMSRGLDGSRVRLRRPGTKYRLDFEKHIPPEGETRFQMVLESRRCSASEFKKAQEILQEREIEFEIGKDPLSSSERLIVQCGPDETKAARTAKAVFVSAFGLDFANTLRAGHKGEFNLDRSRDPMIGWEQERQPKSKTKEAKSQQQEGGGNGSTG